METRLQLIIDTDMSIDDFMAILYLLNRPEVEVMAITVVGSGYCHTQAGVRNALRILDMTGGKNRGILVAGGDEQPLDGFLSPPEAWREPVDRLYDVPLPEPSRLPVGQHSVDLIISLLRQSEQPLTILCIGPLTNIAQVIEREPAIQSKIERLVIMAGALRVKGQVAIPGITDQWNLRNKVTEWNTYVDPLAAQQVIRSGIPITLVPLDATNQVPMTFDFVSSFRESATTPAARLVEALFEHDMGFIQAGIYFFWDPLAACAVVDRDILQFEQRKLDVFVEYNDDGVSDNALGFSPARWDGKPRKAFDLYRSGQFIESEAGQWVEVCTGVEAEAFYQRFIRVLNRQ